MPARVARDGPIPRPSPVSDLPAQPGQSESHLAPQAGRIWALEGNSITGVKAKTRAHSRRDQ
jgi:hypothetical protein